MIQNSCVYLTRRCPRKCSYCALRDAKDVGQELTISQWRKAFKILEKMGIEFNLILGNETWVLGEGLIDLLWDTKIKYALYTTCPPELFKKHRDKFFRSGAINNLSCGVDYPSNALEIDDDSWKKSQDAWKGFEWLKKNYPKVDNQPTITLHRRNYRYLPEIVREATEKNLFVAFNPIHWDKDGKYDFFPSKERISDLIFQPQQYKELENILLKIKDNPGLLQLGDYIDFLLEDMERIQMGWHCGGDPYGGPTIDSDGSLRLCGYRKGTRTPKFSIFDLPEKEQEWREAIRQDAEECPGCGWVYPWSANFWDKQEKERKVFIHRVDDNPIE